MPVKRRKDKIRLAAFLLLFACGVREGKSIPNSALTPGTRVLMDAHNCYPYSGRWGDRIERALKTGIPLAIEQDLFWYTDKHTGRSWSLVSHGDHVRGTEPTLRDYFFERIRPIMEQALHDGDTRSWPLITLNLDFKTDEAAHHAAIWQLLTEYQSWICSAERTADIQQISPLTLKPLLVLTGEADSQQRDFHDLVPVGQRLLAFGAVHLHEENPLAPPEVLVPQPANNYRRWWNNYWGVVEKGGQRKARAWTPQDQQRLQKLVNHAHKMNLWIRFYTLNGHPDQYLRENGWDKGYNFGSNARVLLRWKAAIQAKVDFLATDQYEDLAKVLLDSQLQPFHQVSATGTEKQNSKRVGKGVARQNTPATKTTRFSVVKPENDQHCFDRERRLWKAGKAAPLARAAHIYLYIKDGRKVGLDCWAARS